MRSIPLCILSLILACTGLAACEAHCASGDVCAIVAVADVPKAVVDGLATQAGEGATVTAYMQCTHEGVTTYCAQITTAAGEKKVVKANADGTPCAANDADAKPAKACAHCAD